MSKSVVNRQGEHALGWTLYMLLRVLYYRLVVYVRPALTLRC